MARITINDQAVVTPATETVWEAAADAGIEIPALCHHPDLRAVGSCRLCLVEVDGEKDPVAACTYPIRDGMTVRTQSDALCAHRRQMLQLLASKYSLSGDSSLGKENAFERWCEEYEVQLEKREPRLPVDSDPSPVLRIDMNQCILCTRCVRACEEIQGRFVWGVAERGADTRIVAGLDTTMQDARCESCGACAAYCPTGAIVERQWLSAPADEQSVETTCGYCGVGCQLRLHTHQGRIIGTTSFAEAPVNGHSLCVKGRYGWDFVHHEERLQRPKVRRYLLEPDRPKVADDEWIETDWETALDLTSRMLSDTVKEHGPDAVGVLSSAKCTNEENYLMQKFARQVVGTHNIDHCARLCHSSTVAGLAMAFGSGAMSNSMHDVAEQSAALFVIGSNTTEQHPVFGAMLRQAVLQRRIPLVVADPRAIDLTEFATLHLRQRPGTDVALINGLMHIVLARGWEDAEFIQDRCEGFEEFRQTVEQYPPARVAEITGVPMVQLHRAAEMLATHSPMATIWSMGITQHTTGVLNVLSLANLQMLLGNMGVPGGGVNPLRGQNNVQGACDLGALPNVYPGYQPVSDAAIRQKFGQAWSCTEPPAAGNLLGRTVTEMIADAESGRVQALYILGEDPVMTEPDVNHVRKCLEATPFFVLQEIFPSETSVYADVLLPGACFAEKSGTFTNTERRFQMIHPAVDPPGLALPDWQITSEIARRVLHCQGREPSGPHASWDYTHPSEIMREIAGLVPSYAGVNYERLAGRESLQWPVRDAQHPGTPILHVGNFTRGKGKFHSAEHLPPDELPDAEFPWLLTTGRVLYHWHGGEMTRRSEPLLRACPESVVELCQRDADRLRVGEGEMVSLVSRRGKMRAKATITSRVSEGIVFGNFHFPDAHNVNNLTNPALDPVAKIPEYKVCAVRVEAGDSSID